MAIFTHFGPMADILSGSDLLTLATIHSCVEILDFHTSIEFIFVARFADHLPALPFFRFTSAHDVGRF